MQSPSVASALRLVVALRAPPPGKGGRSLHISTEAHDERVDLLLEEIAESEDAAERSTLLLDLADLLDRGLADTGAGAARRPGRARGTAAIDHRGRSLHPLARAAEPVERPGQLPVRSSRASAHRRERAGAAGPAARRPGRDAARRSRPRYPGVATRPRRTAGRPRGAVGARTSARRRRPPARTSADPGRAGRRHREPARARSAPPRAVHRLPGPRPTGRGRREPRVGAGPRRRQGGGLPVTRQHLPHDGPRARRDQRPRPARRPPAAPERAAAYLEIAALYEGARKDIGRAIDFCLSRPRTRRPASPTPAARWSASTAAERARIGGRHARAMGRAGRRRARPTGPSILARAGRIAHQKLADADEANRLFSAALEADPSCVPAMRGLCALCRERGELGRAARFAVDALAVSDAPISGPLWPSRQPSCTSSSATAPAPPPSTATRSTAIRR